jgi:methionyl-tRNA synthetase
MANNYFVSYDLMAPGQHYDRVVKAIKECGGWAKLEYSLFYVTSASSVEAVAKHIWASMDSNDKLLVVDASNNKFYGYNIPAEQLKYMQDNWYK